MTATGTAATGATPIIDYQVHWYPPKCLEALCERDEVPRARRDGTDYLVELREGAVNRIAPKFFNLEQLFGQADAAGVDMVMSSTTQLGAVLHLPALQAEEILEEVHAAYSETQREHPDRFGGLAMLPMQDPETALAVLDRAIGEHQLKAVTMLASIDGKPIATESTLPVFQRIEELGVPLLLHPAFRSPTVNIDLGSSRAELGVAWMFHTALAALSLIDSGTLDKCKKLVVLHPHLGGVLPYVLGRAEWHPSTAEMPLPEYLRTRFYTDTVSLTPGALQMAIDTYGEDRILLGSDYPYFTIAEARQYVEDNVDGATARRIFANRLPGIDRPAIDRV